MFWFRMLKLLSRKGKQLDLALEKELDPSVMVHTFVIASILGVLLILSAGFLGGCARTIEMAHSTGSVEQQTPTKTSVSEDWTWNRTPQRGSDEKSSASATPVQSE